MSKTKKEPHRCGWCLSHPLYIKYHDEEWGVPVHDDKKLFEFLVLEGAQAGLSWLTILKRREGYREAFCNFDVNQVARLKERDVQRLLTNERIIRNKAKIEATINNAKAFLKIQEEFGSFDKYSWQFFNGKPIINKRRTLKDLPSVSKESDAFSKDLKQRGFKFVGSTIIYAHMQAVGMVNDHLTTCFRYKDLK
ncbi:MAG: DNA-3-methyladenine glycosylase I [Pseudobdellovibrionaceae bacterium]